MNQFKSSYSKFMGYKIACTKCDQLYFKQNDEPFICLTCIDLDLIAPDSSEFPVF